MQESLTYRSLTASHNYFTFLVNVVLLSSTGHFFIHNLVLIDFQLKPPVILDHQTGVSFCVTQRCLLPIGHWAAGGSLFLGIVGRRDVVPILFYFMPCSCSCILSPRCFSHTSLFFMACSGHRVEHFISTVIQTEAHSHRM